MAQMIYLGTMDALINFLGANPYQAIAIPLVGGFASGIRKSVHKPDSS